jgi:hypothetical protein
VQRRPAVDGGLPPPRWAGVCPAQVQASLRQGLARWGRPLRLRVDNGAPWGSTGGLPTDLALWVLGLGVGVWWDRARRPQDNAVVERGHGTTDRWADPGRCRGLEEFRLRVAEEDRLQREVYPAAGGRSRREAYPGLLHSGRGYAAAWEAAGWDLGAALGALAGCRVRRKVSGDGKVSLYDWGHSLGRQYAGQVVVARLDPQALGWVVTDLQGRELRRLPARGLSQDNIVNLRVSRPRGKT